MSSRCVLLEQLSNDVEQDGEHAELAHELDPNNSSQENSRVDRENEEAMDITNDDEENDDEISDDEIIDNWLDGITESAVDIIPDQVMVNNLLRKCRSLISMIKRSTILTNFFDEERKKAHVKRNLSYDVKTRWNSTFHLIDSLLVLREVIDKLFNAKHRLSITQDKIDKISSLELKSDDWSLLSNLNQILRPFFHATRALSGRSYPSIGFAYYIYLRLKNFLQDHSKKDNPIARRLKTLLLKQLVHYFEEDETQLQLLKVRMGEKTIHNGGLRDSPHPTICPMRSMFIDFSRLIAILFCQP